VLTLGGDVPAATVAADPDDGALMSSVLERVAGMDNLDPRQERRSNSPATDYTYW
jgi:hypothetical protein